MTQTLSERLPYALADISPEPLGDLTRLYSPAELAARRVQRAVGRRRDYRSVDPTPPSLSSIASFAGSFAPGAGFADASGLYPDFQGGFEPGLGENIARGNYGTALLQGLGAVGDAFYVAPVLGATIGSALKAPRALQRSLRAASRKPKVAGGVVQKDLPRREFARGVPQHVTDLIQNQKMRAQLLEKIRAGREQGASWYDTQPLRQLFIKELGPDRGEIAFLRYLNFVAATSPLSDVGRNVKNASLYFSLDMQGAPLPKVGDLNPKGYRHFISDTHQRNALKAAHEGLDPLQYPKITSFRENLSGNYAPVTVDMHALRLAAMLAEDKNFLKPRYREAFERGEISMAEAVKNPSWWRGPHPNEYAAIEQLYKELAQEIGLSPAQTQAAAWLGGGSVTGLRSSRLPSFRAYFWDRVGITAKKEGISKEEVLKRFIRGYLKLALFDGMPRAIA